MTQAAICPENHLRWPLLQPGITHYAVGWPKEWSYKLYHWEAV